MAKTRLAIAVVLTAVLGVGGAHASTLYPQTALPGECIPQFAVKLPVFGPGYNADLPRVDASRSPSLTVKMVESQRGVLPAGSGAPLLQADGVTVCPPVNVQPTRIWAYETSDSLTGRPLGPAFWPAVTVEARRGVPTLVRYINNLPSFNPLAPTGPGLIQGLISIDQTIHWANPLNNSGAMMCPPPLMAPCDNAYVGPVPAVPHLHGGEVPSQFDGGPEAWFTPNGIKGPAYASVSPVPAGQALYQYNNRQEAGTPWFHDHALGATRTNVYSGLAAFYFIRDPRNEPANLPSGAYEIEMAIQDRQFDTNSQLFFPDGSGADNAITNLNGPPGNPTVHPFWIPEFFGDVAVVNGSPWPYLNVEPRRYRFRIVDGSNARFYRLSFGAAPVYVIGSDDGYLDAPVPVTGITMGPGERYDIIVDFTGMLSGTVVNVTNDAPAPFPDGPLVPGTVQPTMANIMQFRVLQPLVGTDTSCNPAVAGQCVRPITSKMVRLTDGNGGAGPNVNLAALPKRQLVLKEFAGPGGPFEVLVNNTKWDGTNSPGINAVFAANNGISEMPRVGSTELWEIINLTMDAHPMHTHLAQFQILNRQYFNNTDPAIDPTSYAAAWEGAFGTDPTLPYPATCTVGAFCPGYGPPLRYTDPNADGAIGGNPAVSPYLLGTPVPPSPEESGWKDTAKVWPGQVMRILVRWAPTSAPVLSATPGTNLYPFDPTKGPGYVWHCHIVDHEDNEMMRPYKVAP
jgi:FtsP/CotA-like multicopper oxidase with cupredoxin domain